MASGFGLNGDKGRCNAPWTMFEECMKKQQPMAVCSPIRDDYIECLHHVKEQKELVKMASKGATSGGGGH
jgi:NADH dehydrogenase (ubiquinone) Fe-S protein 5